MARQNAIAEFFSRENRRTFWGLFLASLVVGAVMSLFGLNPMNILEGLGKTVRAVYENINSVVSHIITWTLLGATVVVPLWLLITLPGRFGRDRDDHDDDPYDDHADDDDGAAGPARDRGRARKRI